MRKILIITPHYPPSNLAAVHRSRLFAQHLPAFGWEPIILTVHENYYEENLDWHLYKLIPSSQRVEKVNAFQVTRPRLIGDIGLRAFYQLQKKALQLIEIEGIDFVYIPVPSFYVSLIGRILHAKTGVKYGIDYIDPWVHKFPGSEKIFSRHWWSTQLAKLLEPVAVKRASLITGVAEGYYKGVKERNNAFLKKCLFGAMPYGGEALDHDAVLGLNIKPYLFKKNGKFQMIYAGAMLPKAYKPLEVIFQVISESTSSYRNVEFHFIGTGKTADDESGYNVKALAEQYDLWGTVVFEYPKRIPYLDVLIHLAVADGVFILGSTEPHYTPSKMYQAVLAEKPVLAVLHEASTALQVLLSSGAGMSLSFYGENDVLKISREFNATFLKYQKFVTQFNPDKIDREAFGAYSAYHVTQKLSQLLNAAVNEK